MPNEAANKDMHQLFNEAHQATTTLVEQLKARGYNELHIVNWLEHLPRFIDASHHDFTEMTLDPS